MLKFTLTALFLSTLAALVYLPAPSEKLDVMARKDAAEAIQQKNNQLRQLIPETRMFTRSMDSQIIDHGSELMENSMYEFGKTGI